jgi:maltose alpha-D-glucosyltransferase / alpha-amylase
MKDNTPSYPKWLKKAIFYQIYPQSFKDSNCDGIGDLNGIIQKLNYIKSLGVNAIWLNPCFESEFMDAGYDITNYYKIAKRYGTNDDMDDLFDEAHVRGIRVCLDLVAGHSSDKHPFFVKSQKSEQNEYSDRYIWTKSNDILPDNFVNGKYARDGNYMKNFFDCQPAINYGYANPNPENEWEQPVTAAGPKKNVKELKKIISYWMDIGADGFRVDMAFSLVKNDKDFTETNKLWNNLRKWFQNKYPDGVLIAEWSDPEKSINAGFMIDFMMHFNVPGYSSLFFNETGTFKGKNCYFDLEGKGNIKEFIKNFMYQINCVKNKGFVSIPTANHDFQRPNSGRRNTTDQLKVLMTFILTIPGIPFIYYGDEIGMRFVEGLPEKEGSIIPEGNRAGTRTPMQWNSSEKAGFSEADISIFYLPLDTDPNRPNVQEQKKDPDSLLNFVRKLTSLRKKYKALGNTGDFKPLFAKDHAYPFIFERSAEDGKYIVVINPSEKKVTAEFTHDGIKKLEPVIVDKVICKVNNSLIKVTAGEVSYGIFKIVSC